MFSYSQDNQTPLVNSELKSSEHQGNRDRSQERLIQSLFLLPNYWKLVPCIDKRPLGKKWQDNYYSPQGLFRSLSQEGKVLVRGKHGLYSVVPNGYSLLCGHQSGDCGCGASPNKGDSVRRMYSDRYRYLVAIDCDSYEALNQFEQMRFPTTVSYGSGLPGHRQYLYYVDRPIKSFKLTNGLEVRGRNLLSTLPPSVHPITGKYRWLIAPDRCEILTISSLWLNQLRPQPKTEVFKSKVFSSRTVEELIRAINPIYADIYDDWIRVGMALKDWDEGLSGLWDEWSRSSGKYKPGECSYRWSTFNGSGITFRTLYYYARIG
ncbi:PriCT-2 domain-containing protein [Myxosarcina sp. GI1]|uniref:PriCT-2 domain-containing protein n=1 Tax=Myxosarcina sp. GI1 TaxID=1541065 RepID=UPI000565F0E8|nr:PriCT-2 domain-containing protein [Myxosarcina sp. GI1]